MTPHKKPRARLLRSLFVWHRYLGLTAALFVIVLALTGLLLNHTGELALDARHVRSPALLDWYGITAPEKMSGYALDHVSITEVGNRIYWNTTLIPQATPPLIGAVQLADLIVVGIQGQLLLFTPDGDLIERMGGAAGVPAGMHALGVTAAGELAIQAAHGFYRTDENLLEWHESAELEADWATPSSPAPSLKVALRQAYRGTGLPLERVLLDLHSGRILGAWGVYLMDGAALLFLVLAISGVWLWSRRRASQKAHQRKIHHRKS